MLCQAEHSLLLVVDLQTRLLAAMPEAERAQTLRHAGVLLQAAAELAVPVLATEQYPQGLGPTVDEIRAQLPSAAPVLDKTSFSCCGANGFIDAVEAHKRGQLVIVGAETHVCVLQTALELHARGRHVFVVEDAVTSRHLAHKRNALARMRQAGVVVTNVESVLFEWLRVAGTPSFKKLSQLIR